MVFKAWPWQNKSKYKIRKKYEKQTKVYHDFGLVRLYNCSDLTLKL